jgi:hypothetical protein
VERVTDPPNAVINGVKLEAAYALASIRICQFRHDRERHISLLTRI